MKIRWLKKPDRHNYPAARSYLTLVYTPGVANRLVHQLKKAPMWEFKAKDIFRASGLSLLGVSNDHVEKDRERIKDHKFLSPLLLVRDLETHTVIIADGYHRMCAVYSFDEDAKIPCKIL